MRWKSAKPDGALELGVALDDDVGVLPASCPRASVLDEQPLEPRRFASSSSTRAASAPARGRSPGGRRRSGRRVPCRPSPATLSDAATASPPPEAPSTWAERKVSAAARGLRRRASRQCPAAPVTRAARPRVGPRRAGDPAAAGRRAGRARDRARHGRPSSPAEPASRRGMRATSSPGRRRRRGQPRGPPASPPDVRATGLPAVPISRPRCVSSDACARSSSRVDALDAERPGRSPSSCGQLAPFSPLQLVVEQRRKRPGRRRGGARLAERRSARPRPRRAAPVRPRRRAGTSRCREPAERAELVAGDQHGPSRCRGARARKSQRAESALSVSPISTCLASLVTRGSGRPASAAAARARARRPRRPREASRTEPRLDGGEQFADLAFGGSRPLRLGDQVELAPVQPRETTSTCSPVRRRRSAT